MKVPFMSLYAQRLVQICHRHGAHAMGGMSAFIPSRRDEEVNRVAVEQVSQDKEIEVSCYCFFASKKQHYVRIDKYTGLYKMITSN